MQQLQCLPHTVCVTNSASLDVCGDRFILECPAPEVPSRTATQEREVGRIHHHVGDDELQSALPEKLPSGAAT